MNEAFLRSPIFGGQMILYKWVSEQFVEDALRGKLRIGTLLSYADIENGRNDDHEGFVELQQAPISLNKGERSPARQALARFGFFGDGAIEMHGSGISWRTAGLMLTAFV